MYPHQDDNDPESILVLQETTSDIEKAIETLPEQCRKVATLSLIEGLDNKKIAERLDISTDVVGVQLNRAKKRIRKYLVNKV